MHFGGKPMHLAANRPNSPNEKQHCLFKRACFCCPRLTAFANIQNIFGALGSTYVQRVQYV